jgi:hypothetical protein
MFDEDHRAWLLEFNAGPSLRSYQTDLLDEFIDAVFENDASEERWQTLL